VTFDRAGYPWSDPAPPGIPRTSAQLVQELRSALQKAAIPPPYILVGLSFGAINFLTYALRHPVEVAGLLLLDPSHPEMFERVPGLPSAQTMMLSMRLLTPLARWGWLRPFAGFLTKSVIPVQNHVPPEMWRAQEIIGIHPATFEAATRESEAAVESFAGARVVPGALRDIPLMILTGANQWIKGRPTKTKKAMLALRDELATASTRGEHRIVEESGHIVSVDRPDAVVAAIRELVEARRS
jgi:pimeloyl-ACP methyl ester carboxylesterase